MNNWHSLWRSLPFENKEEASLAFWNSPDISDDLKTAAVEFLGKQRGFRVQTIRKLPVERKANLLALASPPPSRLIEDLFRSLYLFPQNAVLVHLLNMMGIPNDMGILPEDHEKIESPTLEIAQEAIASALREYDDSLVQALVGALVLLHPEIYENLEDALLAALEELPAEEPIQEEPPLEIPLPEEQPGKLNTLDRTVIRTIVSSVAGVIGAPDEEAIEDLVDEVIHLNSGRHQSHFHRGFLDLLMGRVPQLDFPDAEASRRAWYLAGAISALARKSLGNEILEIMDANRDACKHLLQGEHPAIPITLPHLLDALWKANRDKEITKLVDADALAGLDEDSLHRFLYLTTGHILNHDPERAEPLLLLLESALNLRRERGEEVPDNLTHTIERRRAHCLRLRGDFTEARKRLESIKSVGHTEIRARSIGDLGLLDCGFSDLSKIRFPDEKKDLETLASELVKGEKRFIESNDLAGARGGHGAYPLALLAMARRDAETALPHAERAEAFFSRNPRTYSAEGILARAKLALGWALTMTVERPRCQQAADCLESATRELGREGLYLTAEALGWLAEMDSQIAAELAGNLIVILRERDINEEMILDAVLEPKVLARSPDLRNLIVERARAEGRARHEQFRDFTQLLQVAEKIDDGDLAANALDGMQMLTANDPSSEEALAFLEVLDKQIVSTGWREQEIKEAKVSVYKGRGEYESAADLMTRLAFEILQDDDPASAVEARDMVEAIELLGVSGYPPQNLQGRLSALENAAQQEIALKLPEAGKPVRGYVLFLGGNEIQKKYDMDVTESINADYPDIIVDFAHLGWSPNWGRQIEQLGNVLDRADVYVIMRFIRTMCGRHIRKKASERDIPWIACTGHGKSSVERAIREAIRVLGRVSA